VSWCSRLGLVMRSVRVEGWHMSWCFRLMTGDRIAPSVTGWCLCLVFQQKKAKYQKAKSKSQKLYCAACMIHGQGARPTVLAWA
jgi:hypothetical protein